MVKVNLIKIGIGLYAASLLAWYLRVESHCRMIHASKTTWVEGNQILTKLGSLNHENEAIDFDW